jgi:photosystem II stability/assembly factor-like uncharacterized protein
VTAWIAGDNGIILRTTDGGTRWIEQQSGTSNAGSAWSKSTTGLPSGLNDLCFLSQSDIWVVGDDGTAFHSTNGRVSWSRDPSGPAYTFAQDHIHRRSRCSSRRR